ncbi:hypothetical protein FOCC_FOCC011134 [Frankliniella occidentalis]|nr:hypothetical protein FOCC_FOCC011134 [Frankliniella occidentalis]
MANEPKRAPPGSSCSSSSVASRYSGHTPSIRGFHTFPRLSLEKKYPVSSPTPAARPWSDQHTELYQSNESRIHCLETTHKYKRIKCVPCTGCVFACALCGCAYPLYPHSACPLWPQRACNPANCAHVQRNAQYMPILRDRPESTHVGSDSFGKLRELVSAPVRLGVGHHTVHACTADMMLPTYQALQGLARTY